MTTYYVDSSASNASDKNAGTATGSPFASLAALSKITLHPGDTVAIKAGTVYNVDAAGAGALTLMSSGTATQPITITSYGTGAQPVITNTSTAMYSDGIALKNSQYVTIDGIKFGGATQAAVNIADTSSHVTVQNSEMTNVGDGILVKGTNNLVTGNYIHDLHMIKNTPTDKTNATTIAATKNDDYGANGIVVSNSNNELSFNKIVNAQSQSYDYGTDGGGIELFGNMDNVSIHDNYVSSSQGFLEAGGNHSALSNIKVYNNVSHNNGSFLTLHNGGSGAFASSFSNFQANNNTVVNQNNASNSSATVYLDAPATAAQVNITGNIFSLNDGDSIFKQQGGYHSNNLINMQAQDTHLYNNWGMTLGTGEKYGNPGLLGASEGNFTPTTAGFAQTVGATIDAQLQAVISRAATTVSTPVLGAIHSDTTPSIAITPSTTITLAATIIPAATITSTSAASLATASSTVIAPIVPPVTPAIAAPAAPNVVPPANIVTPSLSNTVNKFNSKGNLLSTLVTDVSGAKTYINYAAPGSSKQTEQMFYDPSGKLIEDDLYTSASVAVSKKFITATSTTTDRYNSAGVLSSESNTYSNGTSDYTNYAVTGQSYGVEHLTYAANGSIIEDDQYSSNKTLLMKSVVSAIGKTIDRYSSSGALASESISRTNGTSDYTNYAVTGQSYAIEHVAYAANGSVIEDDQYSSSNKLLTKTLATAGGKTITRYGSDGNTTVDTYDSTGNRTLSTVTSANGAVNAKALAENVTMVSGTHNDTFTSFHNDTFTIHSGFGNDAIIGFKAGNGNSHDLIQIDKSLVGDFAHLSIKQSGSDAVISITPQDTLTLKGINPTALTSSDFKFA